MPIISPTVTAENAHVYRSQMELLHGFAKHIHVDLMDGVFTPNKSVNITQTWLPEDITCDIHLMHQKPKESLEKLIDLRPRLVVVPAESDCNFEQFAKTLKQNNIQFGVALLAHTSVDSAREVVKHADHVLVFSGNLGYQGGSTADLKLLDKVAQIKAINPDVEIGWDGGVNDRNVKALADGGIDIINTGGFIHHSDDPEGRYHQLQELIS